MRKPTDGIDYTNKDYEAFRTDMISELIKKMPEYTDTSQSDFGIVLIELLSRGLDVLSYNQDNNANECFIPTCQQRSSMNNWTSPMGYVPKPSTPSRFVQVFTMAFKQASSVTIPKGTVVKTPPSPSEPSVFFETEADLIIPANKLGDERDVQGNYLYTTTVVEGKTVKDDPIGYSNGSADQRFKLSTLNALPPTLEVLVYNGTSYDLWSLVDSFIDSRSDDQVYRIDQDDDGNTEIIFGDGFTGEVPPASVNPIYANYRVGGGELGNVAPRTITLLDSNSTYIKSTFNPFLPLERGIDREDIESIRRNIPVSSRTRWGLIKEDDFSNFILKDYSDKVSLVKSVKNSEDTLKIDIYVLTRSPYSFNEVKDIISPDITERLLIGGSFSVHEPSLHELSLTLSLSVKDFYNRASVKANVIGYLSDYFRQGNIPFGAEIIFSDVCSAIKDSIEGIKTIRVIDPSDDILNVPATQLIQLTSITVDAIGGEV